MNNNNNPPLKRNNERGIVVAKHPSKNSVNLYAEYRALVLWFEYEIYIRGFHEQKSVSLMEYTVCVPFAFISAILLLIR